VGEAVNTAQEAWRQQRAEENAESRTRRVAEREAAAAAAADAAASTAALSSSPSLSASLSTPEHPSSVPDLPHPLGASPPLPATPLPPAEPPKHLLPLWLFPSSHRPILTVFHRFWDRPADVERATAAELTASHDKLAEERRDREKRLRFAAYTQREAEQKELFERIKQEEIAAAASKD
jgi:hypothetical protein